jgi:hypothetical protein
MINDKWKVKISYSSGILQPSSAIKLFKPSVADRRFNF